MVRFDFPGVKVVAPEEDSGVAGIMSLSLNTSNSSFRFSQPQVGLSCFERRFKRLLKLVAIAAK